MKMIKIFGIAMGIAMSGLSYGQGAGNSLDFGSGVNIVSFGNPALWNTTFAGANKHFTLSMWLYFNSISTVQMPLGKFADSVNCVSPERQIMLSYRVGGKLWFGYYMNDLVTYSHRHISTPSGVISANKWTHVAITYDGSINTNNGIDRVQIYIDGVAQATSLGAQTGVMGDIIAAPSPLVIGAQTRSPSTACNSAVFDGRADELSIWNRKLTQTEIRDNMCKNLVGNEAGLVGYWNFDEGVDNTCGSGTDVCDLTGNGNHGTKL